MKPRRFKIISSSSGTLFECMDQPVTTMAEEVVDSGGRVPHVQSHACLRHEYAHAFRAHATHACGLAVFAQPCCIRIVVFLFHPNLGCRLCACANIKSSPLAELQTEQTHLGGVSHSTEQVVDRSINELRSGCRPTNNIDMCGHLGAEQFDTSCGARCSRGVGTPRTI